MTPPESTTPRRNAARNEAVSRKATVGVDRRSSTVRDMFSKQREILEQLTLCSQVIEEAKKADFLTDNQKLHVRSAVASWYLRLILESVEIQSSVRDIPDEPDPKKRALL
jgi:hypothetical protein